MQKSGGTRLIFDCSSKKGSALDIAGIIIGVFIFVIVLFMFGIFILRLGDVDIVQDTPEAQRAYQSGHFVFTRLGDNLVLMAFVGLSMVALISALFSRAHIVFAVVSIIVSMMMIIISVGMSNAYETFSTNTAINEMVQYYPKTDFIMRHLPTMSLAVMFLVGIVLFVQWRRGRDQF